MSELHEVEVICNNNIKLEKLKSLCEETKSSITTTWRNKYNSYEVSFEPLNNADYLIVCKISHKDYSYIQYLLYLWRKYDEITDHITNETKDLKISENDGE